MDNKSWVTKTNIRGRTIKGTPTSVANEFLAAGYELLHTDFTALHAGGSLKGSFHEIMVMWFKVPEGEPSDSDED